MRLKGVGFLAFGAFELRPKLIEIRTRRQREEPQDTSILGVLEIG